MKLSPDFASDLRMDRRAFLGGLGAVTIAPYARAATAPVPHKVGAVEVMVVSDGVLNVPLSFTLPENTSAEAAALFKANNLPEQIQPAQTNPVLIRTGNEFVLIDAGSGPNFQPTAGKLQENLEAAGIAPEKITKVIFTHAHADHLWGAIDDFGDGDRFPNASYVIAAQEWDFWRDPATADKMPDWLKGMALGTARTLAKIENKIERRKAGDTVAPGYLARRQRDPFVPNPEANGHSAFAPQNESTEGVQQGIPYCCDAPRLVWHGDSEAPGIACANCGYVLADKSGKIARQGDNACGESPTMRAPQPRISTRQTQFLR